MAITPSLPSTQPGSPSINRRVATPRFAGGNDGPSSTPGVNEPHQDSFSLSHPQADVEEFLQQTQGDMDNLDAFLASLDRRTEAEKAHNGDQAALGIAALNGNLPPLHPLISNYPPIADPEALIAKIKAREQELANSWLPEFIHKYLFPSPMDAFSTGFKNHLDTLHGLKTDGANLDDHFAQQRQELKEKPKAAFKQQMDSQRQMMRDMLKESNPGLKDDDIEARIDAFYQEQKPAVEAELKNLGLDNAGISNLYSNLGLTDEDDPSQPKPASSSRSTPNE